MVCVEEPRYSKDYLDPEKRSIANAVQVFFKDGSNTKQVAVEYPIGHRRRRSEGLPLLMKKFEASLASRFAPQQCESILRLCADAKVLDATPVDKFTDMFAKAAV
jgi:2-methylcitrate dehydratase